MGQNNSERISHLLSSLPNTFRDDHLEQILNDLDEDIQERGYAETARTGSFVSSIDIWETSSKLKKRKDVAFSRAIDPPFVDTETTQYYAEDGVTVVATRTAVITRDSNKQITDIDVQITRP